jgi:CRISPR-associated endonuclease/helicase Cas3
VIFLLTYLESCGIIATIGDLEGIMALDADGIYIARRRVDGSEQAVLEHLRNVAADAARFSAVFGAGDLGFACGIAHDIGKYSDRFQQRVRGKNIQVDHSTAGGKWLFDAVDNALLATIMAYCCLGHHSGLPDGGSDVDSACEPTLRGRLNRDIPDYSAHKTEITSPPSPKPPSLRIKDGFGLAFFVRMLFSALVDADRLDAEKNAQGEGQRRGGFADISALNGRVSAHIAHFLQAQAAPGSLNAHRTDLLKDCLNSAENPAGLFTLTGPTGSGKTKSTLAFAFKHAAIHGKRRVIYIAPYNTIIEQNSAVFEEILGAANVLRHYGNHYYDSDDEEYSNKHYSAENWDFPMITTSSVQFFESLFSSRPSVCRKFQNIAESVIIFDEAQ